MSAKLLIVLRRHRGLSFRPRDVWDDLWQLQLGGSITMHVFDTPPARV